MKRYVHKISIGLVLIFLFCLNSIRAQVWNNPVKIGLSNYLSNASGLNGLDFVNDSIVFAVGADGGIYKSSNSGVSWKGLNSGSKAQLFEVDFVNPSKGWAVGANGTILATSDSGNTWVAQISGTTNWLTSVSFWNENLGWAVGGNSILTTSNGGTTWTAQTSPVTQSMNDVQFVSATQGWAVGGGGRIITTSNGGSSWTTQTSGTTQSFNEIIMLSATIGFAVGNNGIIYKTNGSTWTAQTSGTTNSLNGVHFTNSTQGCAVGNFGSILTTTNGGSTWTSRTSGTNANLQTAFYKNATQVIAAGNASVILNSINAGVNWSLLSAPASAFRSVSFVTNNEGWIAGFQGAIYKTTDGGFNWENQSIGNSAQFFSIHFPSTNKGWVVGSSGVINSTSNGGTLWTSQTSTTTQGLTSVHSSGESLAWVVGNNGTILATTNGGTTWAAQTSGTTNSLNSVFFINSTTGWAVGVSGTILKTTNGGSTWVTQTSGTTSAINTVHFTSANNGWAATSNGTVLKTIDGGTTWNILSPNLVSVSINSIFFANINQGWLVGNQGLILATNDGGLTWNPQASGIIGGLNTVFMTSPTKGIAAGQSTDLLLYDGLGSPRLIPQLTIVGPLGGFTTSLGNPSTIDSFYVSGTNLSDNVTITAPNGFQISSSISGFTAFTGTSATVTMAAAMAGPVKFYVRLSGVVGGNLTGAIAASSGGALNKYLSTGTSSVLIITPKINSIVPLSAKPGDLVSISGINFASKDTNNVVYFGATKAQIIFSSDTLMTVMMPYGATYGDITEINKESGLSCKSKQFFNPIYSPSKASLTATDFSANVDFTTTTIPSSTPTAFAIGDLDGDGKADLVVGHVNSSSFVTIFRNTSSSGSITSTSFAPKFDLQSGFVVSSIAISDLDRDGKLDLIIASNATPSSIKIYRNKSVIGRIDSGSFEPVVSLSSNFSPIQSLAVGDLDLDGKPEIVISGSGISIYKNTSLSGNISSGSFSSSTNISLANGARNLAIGDLDGDGRPEILAINPSLITEILVLPNISSPGSISSSSFSPSINLSGMSSLGPINDFSLGDLDGDGKIDIIAACGLVGNSGGIRIYKNITTGSGLNAGSFDTTVLFSANPFGQSSSVSVGDLTGDGKPDIAFTYNNTRTGFGVFRNKGIVGIIDTASFAFNNVFPGSSNPGVGESIIADVDGDGRLDLLGLTNTSSVLKFYAYRNSGAATLLAAKVITTKASTVKDVTAVLGGNVTSDGGSLVTQRGIVYATTANPTLANTKVVISGDLGPFSQTISGLTSTTLYHFRAYAINGIDTSYGGDSTFTTLITYFPPTITSINPAKAKAGDTLTITGTNFSAIPANNMVFFGGVRAAVKSATTTQLIVYVPLGASHSLITELNTVSSLSCISRQIFTPIYSPSKATFITTDFDPRVDFSSSNGPDDLGSGDFDGDGKIDLVTVNGLTNNISIYRNISTPGIIDSTSFAAKIDFATGTKPIDIAVTDLDADGKLDIVVLNSVYSSSTGSISVFKNTSVLGTISFAAKQDFSVLARAYNLAIGDLDGDGKPDIAVTTSSTSSNSIIVFKNTSSAGVINSGSFAGAVNVNSSISQNGSSGIAIGDLNNDGKLDIAISQSEKLLVFQNTSTSGTFNTSSFASPVSFGYVFQFPIPGKITLTDLNGDSKLDVAISTITEGTESQLVFYLNTFTSGTITSSSFSLVNYFSGFGNLADARAVAATDLTGDGKPDLVSFRYGNMNVYRNNYTSGTLTASSFVGPTDFFWGMTSSSYKSDLISGDIDGDGRPDMIVSVNSQNFGNPNNPINNRFSVFRNTGAVISSPAAVSTSTITSIAITSANLGGNVTNSGGASVTERGVVYATTLNPTTANTKVQIGTGTGSYSQTITGLTASTLYHVRAYAINSQGTSYGADSTFTTSAAPALAPTLSTTKAASVAITSATLGGIVSDSGTAKVTERGVVYGTAINPTLTNTKVQIGSGIGSFSQSITGLTATTLYHVRAYAINSVGTSYGADSTFTTLAPPALAPSVSTAEANSIGITSATLGGIVSDSGTAIVTERGIVYGTTINPTTANTKVQIGSGVGTFSQNITGLVGTTLYHVRAYAINSVGTTYGADSTFTTLTPPTFAPSVSTAKANLIGITNATLGGIVSDSGTATVTERGIVYATTINPTIANSKIQIGSGIGSYSQNITGLVGATLYHVRAYAINSIGTTYGADSIFTTLSAPTFAPTVSTAKANLIGITNATLGGNVSDSGTAAVSERGVVYATTINPTITANTKVQIGSGIGAYSQNITGLTGATLYHVRAYAINSVGITYGADSIFTTLAAPTIAPSVTTAKANAIGITSATLGGTVIDSGTAAVSERGIVYATTLNPTTSTNTKVQIGTGLGAYSQSISGLTGSTLYHVRAYAINSVGTSYGADSTFTTLASPTIAPTVSTSKALSIGLTSATLGGTVLDSGTALVSERGIVYATSINPTTANVKVPIGLGLGAFSQNIPGLTASTLYHVRAYAINSVGTSYGADSVFATLSPSIAPSVITATATLVGTTTATLGGIVSDSGTATVTERGVVYATTLNPTIANTKVQIGAGVGNYSQNITGLTASTLYHVRAYAINTVGTSYGADSIFTTSALPTLAPTVNTASPSLVGITSATLGGNVTNAGTATVTERGVVYATSLNPTTSNTKVQIGSGTGVFSQNVTGLIASTLYHVRAYAINSVGTSYGADSTFTTLAAATFAPTVTTSSATSIGLTSATLGGNVTNAGTSTVTERGVVYATTFNPTTANSKVIIGSGTGVFSQNVTGLTSATLYHVRAYAINNVGTSYGSDSIFTTATPAIAPTVLTSSPTLVGINSATLGGNVTDSGTAIVSERGIVYSTGINPTTANTKVQIGIGSGSFSQNITGLTAANVYHIRAYAINSVGISYGADSLFTTTIAPTFAPTVSTTNATSVGITSANLGGNVTNAGTATVTERGVVYSTTINPTTANTKVLMGIGTGVFSQLVTGLTSSTVYHVRAYAINSVGTSYGADSVFTTLTPPSIAPTVSTNGATSIAITSATLGGNVSNGGTANVTERGIVYATIANPTTANTKVQIGSGTGVFSQNVTGLVGSTLYHVRAYAINSVGISYGADSMFTTLPAPTNAPSLSTSNALSVSITSAILGGNVTNAGTATVTERGIVYSTSINPTTVNTKVQMGDGTGVYSETVTGLTAATIYHVRAYAINSVGITYGADSVFTTLAAPTIIPTVTTTSASLVTTTSSTLGGDISDAGTAIVTERGVVYGTAINPTTANSKVQMGAGIGTFSQNITNLTPSTLYHVRAYAINSVGISYGADSTFTTLTVSTIAPTVSTNNALSIGISSATLGGNVIDAGSATVTERGIVYGTATNPTTLNTKVAIGTGTGAFSQNITGLTATTLYHVRAYAINSVGISYGADTIFTTLTAPSFAPVVSTGNASLIGINNATLSGIVLDSGTASVIEHGIVYSTSLDPTTSDYKVIIGNGIGSFAMKVTSFVGNTLYHVRAYAINSVGITYGSDITFTTEPYPISNNIIGLNQTICSGTSPNLLAGSPPFGGRDPYSYNWISSTTSQSTGFATAIGSNSNIDYTPGVLTQTTWYRRVVSSGVFIDSSETIAIIVNPLPAVPTITIKTKDQVCLNTKYQNFGTANLPPVNINYNWSAVNADVYAQGNDRQFSLISFPNVGSSRVILTATDSVTGCSSRDSFAVNVSQEISHEPIVQLFDNNFICKLNDVVAYQWGFDNKLNLEGNKIADEINQNYYNPSPDLDNKYYWVATEKGNCTQKTYYNTALGLASPFSNVIGLNLYPNPVSDQLTVELLGKIKRAVTLQIIDMLGNVKQTKDVFVNENTIHVSELSTGIYMVYCYQNGTKVATKLFVKTN